MKELLGMGAACAACCALPIAFPVLAGVTAAGFGQAIVGWPLGLALLVVTAATAVGIVALNRRRAEAATCASSGPSRKCNCAAQCKVAGPAS